ncbi:MAG: AAA family ATPase [Desulfovibrionaceae bacterium]
MLHHQEIERCPAGVAEKNASEAEPFKDNLDHLQALEREFTLLLAWKILKRGKAGKADFSFTLEEVPDTEIIPGETPPELFRQPLEEARRLNRARERASIQAGVELRFLSVCDSYGLDDFEREVLLLYFLKKTSPDFQHRLDLFLTEGKSFHTRMELGDVLSLLCNDYREQTERRQHFCVESTFMKHNILVGGGRHFDEEDSIIDECLSLHQRLINYIIGDDNIYASELSFLRKEQSRVRLEQVALQDGLKEEVVSMVESFAAREASDMNESLRSFYGYGAGLALLFTGFSGTGKTMLAYALANHLGKTVLSINGEAAHKARVSMDEAIRYIFQEAKLSNGLVLFDECDDVFEADTSASNALLIEIEKSDCIVILSTNKPIKLDQALERRINKVVSFRPPRAKRRRKLWSVLQPEHVKLAADADLDRLAERYRLTGGLIKNSWLGALNSVMAGEGEVEVRQAMLEQAVEKQSEGLYSWRQLGKTYRARGDINQAPLSPRDRSRLQGMAYTLEECRGAGGAILVTCQDQLTAQVAVEAALAGCEAFIRRFDLSDAVYGSRRDNLVNPYTHETVDAMEYMFLRILGPKAQMVFSDHAGLMARYFDGDGGDIDKMFQTLIASVVRHTEPVVVVTSQLSQQRLPPEFLFRIDLGLPPEEAQIQHWIKQLEGKGITEETVVDFVERHPLHLRQIVDLAGQAGLLARLHPDRPNGVLEFAEEIQLGRGRGLSLLFGAEGRV